MNLEEKVQAILDKVNAPATPATVDPQVITDAVNAAVAPLAAKLDAIEKGVVDIQGQVDVPPAA